MKPGRGTGMTGPCDVCGHFREDHISRAGCTHRRSYVGAPPCPCPEFAVPRKARVPVTDGPDEETE